MNSSIGAGEINDNGGTGIKQVSGNTVADKLSCKRNDATFSGGPNTAAKTKGQYF